MKQLINIAILLVGIVSIVAAREEVSIQSASAMLAADENLTQENAIEHRRMMAMSIATNFLKDPNFLDVLNKIAYVKKEVSIQSTENSVMKEEKRKKNEHVIGSVGLGDFLKAYSSESKSEQKQEIQAMAEYVSAFDAKMLSSLGLEGQDLDDLVLRVAKPAHQVKAMAAGVEQNQIWVTYDPGDEKQALTAFDGQGVEHTIKPDAIPPSVTVLAVADSDAVEKAHLDAGAQVFNNTMQKYGMGFLRMRVASASEGVETAAERGNNRSFLVSFRANDVQEPWIKGDAEIYTLVSGLPADGTVEKLLTLKIKDKPGYWGFTKPEVKYYYERVGDFNALIDWNKFKEFQGEKAVNLYFKEADTGTDYGVLALGLIKLAKSALDAMDKLKKASEDGSKTLSVQASENTSLIEQGKALWKELKECQDLYKKIKEDKKMKTIDKVAAVAECGYAHSSSWWKDDDDDVDNFAKENNRPKANAGIGQDSWMLGDMKNVKINIKRYNQ